MCCIILSCFFIRHPAKSKKRSSPAGDPPPYESIHIQPRIIKLSNQKTAIYNEAQAGRKVGLRDTKASLHEKP
ncbi:hypothetical protein BU25DRAFT_406290 [Macroventuria anomochaeta]|uniref:Uncharacterized protein n=1 Tax=Macroventuria anomochaeta TaxID=301207 RepID=A0ACB6SI42_9PLEO|nr:uncharacterized protein BU25DRAFT_406290 [Macroventuria anomochaeta]KAF2633023.1 hypothetical protein BU25DRAFT_406290 [Macroventuria anomochaeta]